MSDEDSKKSTSNKSKFSNPDLDKPLSSKKSYKKERRSKSRDRKEKKYRHKDKRYNDKYDDRRYNERSNRNYGRSSKRRYDDYYYDDDDHKNSRWNSKRSYRNYDNDNDDDNDRYYNRRNKSKETTFDEDLFLTAAQPEIDDKKQHWIRSSDIDMYINPHLEQLELQNKEKCQFIKFNAFDKVNDNGVPALRLLHHFDLNTPQDTYKMIPHDHRTTNHWGQRKLMLSEVEFLTRFYSNDEARLMIYAGAAPGTHTPFLAEMFPKCRFLLVDPAPFDCQSDVINIRNIQIADLEKDEDWPENVQILVLQDFFTDDLVSIIKKSRVLAEFQDKLLFVSDIRTADSKVQDEEEVEACIQRDMEWQMRWSVNLNPIASMHKFRLPWAKGESEYLAGEIYLPIWGPQTTTETRLIVTDHDAAHALMYDHRRYEQQMFHFNTVSRVHFYSHPITNVDGYDHCYDCASEIIVLRDYINKVKGSELIDNEKKLKQEIKRMAENLSAHCSTSRGRTLSSRIGARNRKQWFSGRVYDVDQKKIVPKRAAPVEERMRGGCVDGDKYEARSIRMADALKTTSDEITHPAKKQHIDNTDNDDDNDDNDAAEPNE